MQVTRTINRLSDEISRVLINFAEWLHAYGESSWDYQSVYAGPIGGWAKSQYYRRRLIGKIAVEINYDVGSIRS